VFQVTDSPVQIMCLALIDIEQQKLKTGIQQGLRKGDPHITHAHHSDSCGAVL
jgi:hypothetical protein